MSKVTKKKGGTMKKVTLWGMLAISLGVIVINAALGTSSRMFVVTLLAANGFFLGFIWLQKATIMVLLITYLYQAGVVFAGGVGSKVVGIVLIFPLVLALFLDINGLGEKGKDLKESLKDKELWKVAVYFSFFAMLFTSLAITVLL